MKVANISFQFAKAKHIFGNKHDNLTNCEIRIMHFIIYVRVVSKERGKYREREDGKKGESALLLARISCRA